MAENSPKDKKTLWEKEKLLVTSNFSFSHSVFNRPVVQTRKNQGLFGKGLTTLKGCEKRRKYCQAAFSPFLTVFFSLSQTEIIILATLNLSSANAFNLAKTKSLSFGKQLRIAQLTSNL